MKKPIISDAITNISPEYIEKAAEYTAVKPHRRPGWVKWSAMAACLALVLTFALLQLVDSRGINNRYKYVTIMPPSLAIAWEWKYLTVSERYLSIDIDGVNYIRLGEEINASVIGEKIGTYEAVGDNAPYETPEGGYREWFDAYAIENVSPAHMLALKMEDSYYCFISDAARAALHQMTWGDVLDAYGLSDAIRLDRFTKYKDGREQDAYLLGDDAYVWEVLSACRDAKAVDSSEWENDGTYYCFTVTSDVFGIYKKAMYVTESGYVWTNMLEVECIYQIGKDAAGKIIAYVRDNSERTQREAYYQTVTGTITEITDAYVLIDDSVLCKKASDGVTYKILRNDLRFDRYVTDNRIALGDVVQVTYKDPIDVTKDRVIDSAIGASPVSILDGTVEITEITG